MNETLRQQAVDAVNAGDIDAWQQLVIEYHATLAGRLAATLDPNLRHRVSPDDVLQEAYVAAFKALAATHFDGPGGFYKWLETIALRKLSDAQQAERAGKRDIAREHVPAFDPRTSYPNLVTRLAADDSTPSRKLVREEAIAAVMTSLARLSDDHRAIIRRRFLEGRPVAGIASELGKSEAAVHMLCHRALKALRQRIVAVTRHLTSGGI